MGRHALRGTFAISLLLAACSSGGRGGPAPACLCASPLQVCDPATGACTCPAPCASGATACAADGTRVTCGYDVAGGCLVFPAGAGTPCAGVQVCNEGGSGATCACPADGDRAGQGCVTAGAHRCDAAAAAVDVCLVDAASGCLAWAIETSCAGGLVCGSVSTGGDPLVCECSRHAPDDGAFWADAVAGGTERAPSGTATPPGCRFATLADAIAAAAASTAIDVHRAVASGVTPPAGWKPWAERAEYGTGEVVLPRRANGHAYRAASVVGGVGASGTVEPVWPVAPAATVVDGDVTWQEQGSVPGMIFGEAPLTIPARVTLTTEGCETGACEPRLYLLPYDATLALDVAGALKGFTVSKMGSAAAAAGAPAVRATGTLDHVAVYADNGAVRTPLGVEAHVARLTNVTVSGAGTTGVAVFGTTNFGTFMEFVTVVGTTGDGVAVAGSLVCFDSSIQDNAGAGVSTSGSGNLQFERGAVFGNGGVGISARNTWLTLINANDVHGNGDTGIVAQRSQETHVWANRVHGNGASGSVGGIHLVGESSPGFLAFGQNRVYANRAHQVLVQEDLEPVVRAAWMLDGTDEYGGSSYASTFACYDATGPWVGVATAGWAQVTARANSWASPSPALGVDWAACADCSVDASAPLAPLLDVTCP